MKQREKLKNLIVAHCNEHGNRTFSLQDLNEKYNDFHIIDIGGKTPGATVRRIQVIMGKMLIENPEYCKR